MSDSDHDDEFEAYLKQRKPIHKGVGPLEPPPELDRIVIGQARQAIQNPRPTPVYRAPKWALPMGLAATILISFAVMLGLGVRASKHLDARTTQAQAVDSQAPATTAAGIPAPDAPASDSPAAQASAAVAKPPPIATAPWPPIPRRTIPSTAASSAALGSEGSEQPVGDKARTRLAHAEVAAKRLRPEGDTAAGAAGQRQSAASERVASAASEPVAAGSDGGGEQAAVPAETPSVVQASSAKPATSVAPVIDAGRAAAPVVTAAPAVPTSAPPPTPAAYSSAAPQQGRIDPVTWLLRIEKLRSEGHTTQAEEEIKRFRDAYPDYPLPARAPPADARAQ
jgi:hypothetical protein